MKKTFIIVLIVLIVIIITNFIYTSFEISSNNYNMTVNDYNISNIFFNREHREHISFKSGLENEREKLLFYKYRRNSDLIVYKINDFKDINLKDTHLYLIDKFRDISINPQSYHDFGYFELTSKLGLHKEKSILLYSNKKANILKHFENDTSAYISIFSYGLLIANNENEPQIKINSINQRSFNIYLEKKDDAIYLFILTNRDSAKIGSNTLLNIMN